MLESPSIIQELKFVIEAEGEEVPGSSYWDAKECVMKKRQLPKVDYLEAAQGALLKNEVKPVYQKGATIRQEAADRSSVFCVVSFYRCRDRVVRIQAHDQERQLTYRMVLTPTILQVSDGRKSLAVQAKHIIVICLVPNVHTGS